LNEKKKHESAVEVCAFLSAQRCLHAACGVGAALPEDVLADITMII
jgi:hypothetical protein